jgi:hypothetical protein
MKTGTLLQSFLLAAGLILGGISAVQAHSDYSSNPGNGKYHHFQHDKRSSGHTPWWSSSYHGNHRKSSGHDHNHWQYGRHDGHGDGRDHGDHWKYGKRDGHGDRNDHGDRWKHGKYDGRGDGRDHKDYKDRKVYKDRKDYKKYGRRDGRDDAGRKGHQSRSAGIGYTGRS